MKKCVKINHSRLFLLSFNSKLSHFDKNINLWRKLIWFLIYSEPRGYSELARQIYGERLPQRILTNARTFAASSRFRAFRNE
jgi:hypothetical protein